MISAEDFACVSTLDGDKKGQYLKENPQQCAKTFLNLLSHVSKDTTIQYILVMIDDLLQVRKFPSTRFFTSKLFFMRFRRIATELKSSWTLHRRERRASGVHS